MTGRHGSMVVDVVTRLNVPFIQLFALYVIVHGHYSPGGGFQGGVILAVSIILERLVFGAEESHRRFPPALGGAMGVTGVLVFLLIGGLPLMTGGGFLDYAALPVPGMDPATRRYAGILAVEIVIGIGVWGALVAIFDLLAAEVPR